MSFLDATYQPPSWVRIVRIVQAVLVKVVLIMTAIAFTSYSNAYGSSTIAAAIPGLPFAFFAYAWTVIFLIFAIHFAKKLSATKKPVLIMLILESLTVVWWLITFALLADAGSKVSAYENLNAGYVDVPTSLMDASAGIGALIFCLFVATLVGGLIHILQAQKSAQLGAASHGVPFETPNKEAQATVQPVPAPQPTQQAQQAPLSQKTPYEIQA